jgi:hypothetical protein
MEGVERPTGNATVSQSSPKPRQRKATEADKYMHTIALGSSVNEPRSSEDRASIIHFAADKDECISLTGEDYVQLTSQQSQQQARLQAKKTGAPLPDDLHLKHLARVLELINQKHVYSMSRIAEVPKGKKNSIMNEEPEARTNKTKGSVATIAKSLQSVVVKELRQPARRQANERQMLHNLNLDVNSSATNEHSRSISMADPTQESRTAKFLARFIDQETDSKPEEELKMAVAAAFHREPKHRDAHDLDTLYRFHMRYSFFVQLQKDFGKEAVIQIMKLLKIQRVQKDLVLFDQDEPGDKFYIILKGTVGVEIAMRTEVELAKTNAPSLKVKKYLQHLFDNFDTVFWPRVPYALAVREYLCDVKQAKKALQEAIEDEIYAKLGKKIVSMFEWANWAQQQKKQEPRRTPNKGLEEQELLARRASRYAKALRGGDGNGMRNVVDNA